VFYGPFAEAYEAAWDHAAARVRELPIEVCEIDTGLFDRAASLLYDGPFVEERRAGLGEFLDAHPGSALQVTERILRSGQTANCDGASVFRAMHELRALKREAAVLLDGAVLMMPTAGGTWTRSQVQADPIATNSDMG